MKNASLLVAIACLTAIGALGASEGFKKLTGSYMIASKNLIDPAPGEKKDRVALFLEGDAARDIYNQMPGPARKNACSSDLRTKSSGGLICSKDLSRNDYQCTVGVILKTGAVVDVSVC